MKNLESDYSVLIGLDWANRKHDVCIQLPHHGDRSFQVIGSSAEAVEEWMKSLHGKFQGQIAVALELDKGPIVYALQKYDFVILFPVHRLALAKYREVFSPSGAKDDPSDASTGRFALLVRNFQRDRLRLADRGGNSELDSIYSSLSGGRLAPCRSPAVSDAIGMTGAAPLKGRGVWHFIRSPGGEAVFKLPTNKCRQPNQQTAARVVEQ